MSGAPPPEEGVLQDLTEEDEVQNVSFKGTPSGGVEEVQHTREDAPGDASPEAAAGQGGDEPAHREGGARIDGGRSPKPLAKRNQSMKRKGTIKNLSAMASKSIRNMIDPGKKLGLYRESKVTDGSEALGFDKRPFLMVHPYSGERMTWDAITFFMLIYCCIMVPYNLAFASETICDGYKFVLTSIVDTFFILDIFVNFRTAYFAPNAERRLLTKQELQKAKSEDNFIVTDAYQIAKFYIDPRRLKDAGQGGFFLLDCVGSIPWDWIMCGGGLGDTGDSANVAKIARAPRLLKVLRILRLLRLLRLHRVAVLMRKFRDLLHVNPGLLQLIQFLAMLVLSTHWLACMWFFLGTIMDDDEALINMTEESAMHGNRNMQVRCNTFQGKVVNPDCMSMSETAQYIVSIYWATTSLTTTGFGDIPPVSLPEVIFSIFVLLTGGFMFAYMVANIALMLDKIDILATHNRQKIFEFEGFMHREKIPADLRRRIRKYFQRTHMEQRRMPVYLGELSGSLSKEIYLEIFKDIVVKVPFFSGFDDAPLALIIKHFRYKAVPAGETMFRSGDFGEWMFFLHKGEVELSVAPQGLGREANWKIGAGSFFGENAILGRKTRITTARTLSWCTMYVLSLSDVERTIEKYPKCRVLFEKFKLQMADHNVKRDVQNLVRRWGRRDHLNASADAEEIAEQTTKRASSTRRPGSNRSSPMAGRDRAHTHDGVVDRSASVDAKSIWALLRRRLLPSVAAEIREKEKKDKEDTRRAAIEAIVQAPLDDVSVRSLSEVSRGRSHKFGRDEDSHDASRDGNRAIIAKYQAANIHAENPNGSQAASNRAAGTPKSSKLESNLDLADDTGSSSQLKMTPQAIGEIGVDEMSEIGNFSLPYLSPSKHDEAEPMTPFGIQGDSTPMAMSSVPGQGHWTPMQSRDMVAPPAGTNQSELQKVIQIQQDDLQVLMNHVKMLSGLVETTSLECQGHQSRCLLFEEENKQLKHCLKEAGIALGPNSRTPSGTTHPFGASAPAVIGSHHR